MGFGLSAYSIWKTFSISVPTVADGLTGRGSVARCDARLERWSRGIVGRAKIDLTVNGLERVSRDRAYVLMSNHQSHLDIPILYVAWPGTLRMVAKAELFRMPVFGKALRDAGFVEVDRSGDKQKAIAAMREAGEAVSRGISIWIAPEGTRSETGKLGNFKKGGFLMAMRAGVPIVPVAIDGSRHILPKHSYAMKPGASVRVTFGAPIETEGRTIEQLMEQVRAFLCANVEGAL